MCYTPLVKILGDEKVQEAELQFGPILLLLQQPGQLVRNTPGHAVLATHSVNTLRKKRVQLTFDNEGEHANSPELLAEVLDELLSICSRVEASVQELQPHGLPSLERKRKYGQKC